MIFWRGLILQCLTYYLSFFLQHQLQEEEKLANQQNDTLKGTYKKYELIESIIVDGTARNLAQKYKMRSIVDG